MYLCFFPLKKYKPCACMYKKIRTVETAVSQPFGSPFASKPIQRLSVDIASDVVKKFIAAMMVTCRKICEIKYLSWIYLFLLFIPIIYLKWRPFYFIILFWKFWYKFYMFFNHFLWICSLISKCCRTRRTQKFPILEKKCQRKGGVNARKWNCNECVMSGENIVVVLCEIVL